MPTAIPETKEKRPQESNTGADTTDKTQAAVQTNTFNELTGVDGGHRYRDHNNYLIGAKPLSEPMLDYCELDPREQISEKFELKFQHFHLRRCMKMSGKWRSFCLSCDVLNVCIDVLPLTVIFVNSLI